MLNNNFDIWQVLLLDVNAYLNQILALGLKYKHIVKDFIIIFFEKVNTCPWHRKTKG